MLYSTLCWRAFTVLVIVALTLGCAAVSHPPSTTAEAAPPPVSTEDTIADPPVDVDREAVLDLVRRHRRQASESWRQTLTDAVYRESVAAGVDPLLVASIVARESSFRSRVVSHRGAVGLMQLRPWVARDLARRHRVEWEGKETLHSPELNVRLGVTYFKELVDRFDGDEHMALTAYNYGPTRVSRQVRRGTYSGSEYAERILSTYREWDARRDALSREMASTRS